MIIYQQKPFQQQHINLDKYQRQQFKKQLIAWLCLMVSMLLSFPLQAAPGDADANGNGLIDISTLTELNAIRFNLNGSGQVLTAGGVNDTSGCPGGVCSGYELVNSLDFITYDAGNSFNAFWNGSLLWQPLGSDTNRFNTRFNGNNFSIDGLAINRPLENFVGLFGAVGVNAKIENIRLRQVYSITGKDAVGALVGNNQGVVTQTQVKMRAFDKVSGNNYIGGLVGLNVGTVEKSSVIGRVQANNIAGGLLGFSQGSASNNWTNVSVTGAIAGGLIGDISNVNVNNSYAIGAVTGTASAGLVATNGFGGTTDQVSNSYWNTTISTQSQATFSGIGATDVLGLTTAEMQCPTTVDETSCKPGSTLYKAWDPTIWDFGVNNEYPVLIYNGLSQRDTDGDGVVDVADAFPLDPNRIPDANGNGLIDITNLAELDAMRNNLNGTGLTLANTVTDSRGCFGDASGETPCNGYELLNNLDFDTNGDGIMDANDDYWNGGLGWDPVATFTTPFNAANFNGNYFTISNLYINRPLVKFIGLFSAFSASTTVRNVGFIGDLTRITGDTTVGTLVGTAYGPIIESFAYTRVVGSQFVGGLVGEMQTNASIRQSYTHGSVNAAAGNGDAGGLVGSSTNAGIIMDSYSDANVNGIVSGGIIAEHESLPAMTNVYASGLISGLNGAGLATGGYIHTVEVISSYWDIESTTQTKAILSPFGNEILTDVIGLTTVEMQCPTTANDTTCKTGSTLFNNWDALIWDFGTSKQYPALIFNGKSQRDTDGDYIFDADDPDDDNDGVLDVNDAFPFDPTESVDTDGDGIGNNADLDDDGDGLTDVQEINLGTDPLLKDSDGDGIDDGVEDANQNGVVDAGETNPTLADTDGDGVNDNDDAFPLSATQVPDADGNGLIDITTLAQLNAMRFNLSGTGLSMNASAITDSRGCFGDASGGTVCNGYELMNNLDFDTNGDGVLDVNDSYWNSGAGWDPVGSSIEQFTASIFEGNDFTIANLMINRPTQINIGFFGYASQNTTLKNIGFIGALSRIEGKGAVGTLAGAADGTITQSFAYSQVKGQGSIGGLVGQMSQPTSILSQSYTHGRVETTVSGAGGVVGYSIGIISDNYSDATVIGFASEGVVGDYRGFQETKNIYASGLVSGAQSAGLMSWNDLVANPIKVATSYWDIETTTQTKATRNADTMDTLTDVIGLTTAEMQCPTAPDDTACKTASTLFKGWSNALWDFGNSSQYPVLIINGKSQRDTDGDYIFDVDDLDDDGDGLTDAQEAILGTDPLLKDSDGDGLDDGVEDANQNGVVDAGETNPTLADTDGDGANDNADAFPLIATRVPDADGNGLIDITTLAELNAIRNNLNGTGLSMNSTAITDSRGCFGDASGATVCNGYELLNNLDFDTNGDGVMDANDNYWNGGLGWEPIGSVANSYSAVNFNGNYFTIANLYINHPTEDNVGFFSKTSGNTTLQNVGFIGQLTRIEGRNHVGTLAGIADGSVRKSYAYAQVKASQIAGGLIGAMVLATSKLSQNYTHGDVLATFQGAGGVVGFSEGVIADNYSDAKVTGLGARGVVGNYSGAILATKNIYTTGLISGRGSSALIANNTGFIFSIIVSSSYWDLETTNQMQATNSTIDILTDVVGLTTAEMQCPTAPDDTVCKTGSTLFKGWSSTVWDFGNTSQYPVLIINGKPQRDNDGDYIFDVDDPDDDNDGVLDINDAFPFDAAESVDTDGDGIGNNADTDDDNDGFLDINDAFPLDPTEWLDSDGDGIGNNSDPTPFPPAGDLSFAAATYSVNENSASLSIDVNRANGSYGQLSVDYSLQDGSATASNDYQFQSGTLTFLDGELTKTISLTIIDDTIYEGNETFSASLNNLLGAGTIGAISKTIVTIVENEAIPPAGEIAFAVNSETVNENDGSLSLTINRNGGSFGSVSVSYNSFDGSAIAGSDYATSSGSLSFADGEVSKTITIDLINDATYEADESFTVQLSNIVGAATLGIDLNTVTILDDDPIPPAGVITIENSAYNVNENAATLDVAIQRVGGSFGAVSVDVATADALSGALAASGVDFAALNQTLNFADGEITKTISLTILDDSIYEGDENFNLNLSNVVGTQLGNQPSAVITIVENDAVPSAGVIQFSGANYSVNENAATLLVTITRINGSNGSLSVDVTSSNGSAISGENYQALNTTVSFADGELSRNVTIALIDDNVYEGDKTFDITLSNMVGNATLGNPLTTRVTIIENEMAPPSGTLQLSGVNYSVNEGGGSVILTIMRTNGSFGDVSVGYSATDGSAVNGNDYSLTDGRIYFADGQRGQTLNIKIIDDKLVENTETFTLTLSNPANATLGGNQNATISIVDNDKPQQITPPPTGRKGGGGSLNFWLFALIIIRWLTLFRRPIR